MLTTNYRPIARPAHPSAEQTVTVCVVDGRPQDYDQVVPQDALGDVQMQFAETSSEALKLGRTAGRTIWLVNINLPDGSGCELAAAIRARDSRSVVYLVSDQYDPAEELKARRVSGTMYLCKPAHTNLFSFSNPSPRSH